MKSLKILPLVLAATMLFSACGEKGTNNATSNTQSTPLTDSNTAQNTSSTPTADFTITDADMFTDRDTRVEYDEGKAVSIQLKGDSISSSSNSVKISGTTATITAEGTYVISGSLNNGMIVVNAGEQDKPQIVLNNASINSKSSAALYILEADKVFVTLAPGTNNTLSNGGSFTAIDDNNIDGAIFSKQDLTLNGSGTLTVTSPAGHGIVCKDDLVITGGNYTVESASHGFDANDSVRIKSATISIDAGKDGIHSENTDDESLGFIYLSSGTLKISAEGDGMSAGAYTRIENGSLDIVSGGGSVNATKQTSDFYGGFRGGRGIPQNIPSTDDSGTSIKAIKSNGDILINNGTFKIDSADDSVHSNASVTVNGGTFEISSGDDAFHADEALTITSGTINISKSYEGLEGLNVKISGGDIKLTATDDGINAAGGIDSSGFGGPRGNDRFGGRGGKGGIDGMSSTPGMGGESSGNGSIVIEGGTIYVKASGDGIDANGTLTISGGKTTVVGPTQGDTATLDYDVSATITGGTFIGTGSSSMAQTFSSSQQGVISINIGNQSAGTKIILKDSSKKEILSYTPELPFAVVILSTPELVKGKTYSVTVGSTTNDIDAC